MANHLLMDGEQVPRAAEEMIARKVGKTVAAASNPKETAPTLQALQTEVRQLKRKLFKLERHVELNRSLALMRPARREKPSFEDLSLAIPNRLRGYLDGTVAACI